MPRTLCYIQARGGSKRFPGKNTALWRGKPMIVDAIDKAKATGLFDKIIVTSDSEEILELALDNGVGIHYRLPRYANDSATDDDVARSLLPSYPDVDIFCKLYPCIPLLRSEDIGLAFIQLCAGASGVYSVDSAGNDAGAFYWFRRSEWRKHGTINIVDGRFPWDICILPDLRCQDINYPEDLDKARMKDILIGDGKRMSLKELWYANNKLEKAGGCG